MSDRSGQRVGTKTAYRPVLRSAPWIAILVLTAVVQFVRTAPVDGAVFGLLAVALLIDALGAGPRVAALSRPGLVPVLTAGLAAALVLILTPRHGVADGIVLVGVGVVALVPAWAGVRPGREKSRGPQPGGTRALRRTAILWAGVAVTTCLWELTSFVLGRMLPEQKAQHPAISDLIDPALDQFWFRAVFVVGWIALGIALLARGGRR